MIRRPSRMLAVPFLVLALSSCSASEVQTNFDHFFHKTLPTPIAEFIANAINMVTGDDSHPGEPDDPTPDVSSLPGAPLRHPGRR